MLMPTLLFRDPRTGIAAYDHGGAFVTSEAGEVVKMSEWERGVTRPREFCGGPEDGEVVPPEQTDADRLNVVMRQVIYRYDRTTTGDFVYRGEIG